jgi:glycosyltransferase involved in cell wall biosynthesis
VSIAVALLNPWFWPEVQRGSERLVHDLAVDLVRLGHRPRVLTSHPGRPRRSSEDGFEVVRNWRPPDRPWRMRHVMEGLSHQPFTFASLMRGADDLAHAFFPTDGLPALEWRARTGRPVTFHYGGVPQRNVLANKRLKLKVVERVTTECDVVTVGSRASRDAMWRWLGVEAEIVHPGVDLSVFTPGGARSETPTIVCAADPADGRKRVDLLVRAFAHVRRERPDARLRLVRPADPSVQRRFEADGVEFYDPDPRGVVDVFRSAWTAGLASYNEAFGLVLVESLPAGSRRSGRARGRAPRS